MIIDGSRKVNQLTKWLLLSSVFLLTDSAQTGSPVTSEAGRAVDADENQSSPPPPGLLNVTKGKKPSLQPKPSPPLLGIYSVRNPEDGNICLKAVLGVEFMVTVNKKFYYFNMNPLATRATGYCGNTSAVLSLEFDGGYLEFHFVKEAKAYYTRRLSALLEPAPVCKKCKTQPFPGTQDNKKLFKTTAGLSFKCKSELVVKMASDLRLKIVPAQFQPFNLSNGQFGKDFECWEDYIRRIVPIILGAIAVGVALIAVVSYLVIREYRNREYESL